MRFRPHVVLGVLVAALAAGDSAWSGPNLPEISFAGSQAPRWANPDDDCPLPFPPDAPIAGTKADSLIVLLSGGKQYPETRYDLFQVDLDNDDRPEEIAQVSRITAAGFHSRCWWGVYSRGQRDQVLFWSRATERTSIGRMRRPGSLRDKADTLSFMHSIPEFFPAVDVVKFADLTGDGKPEIVVWMAGRALSVGNIQGMITPLILSATSDSIREVFRGTLLFVRHSKAPPDYPKDTYCGVTSFRLHSRLRHAAGPLDLLIEPWLPTADKDSLCLLLGDERNLPHDPDVWFPLRPLPPDAPIPQDWMVSRWDGRRYGGYWFVRDVRLE